MAGVGSTNISLNSLRTAWGNASYAGGSDPGSTNISLSEFRGATFTDGTSVPSSEKYQSMMILKIKHSDHRLHQ